MYAKRREHGDSGSPEHRVWKAMLARCRSNDPRYGGRGIKVCKRWMKYENFLADMGRRPTPHHQIDRIDNDGIYEPDNCRWATRSEQMLNRRKYGNPKLRRPPAEVVCKGCGKTTRYSPPSSAKSYCSHECYARSITNKPWTKARRKADAKAKVIVNQYGPHRRRRAPE